MICGYLCCITIAFCDSIYCSFWFVLATNFWYSSLYIQVFLSCWSLTFKCISHLLHFTLLFSSLLILVSYLFVDDFLLLLYVSLYQLYNLWFSCFWLWPLFFFFLSYICSFSICSEVGLVVLNSLIFCFSVKLLISLPTLNERALWYRVFLFWGFFPFFT